MEYNRENLRSERTLVLFGELTEEQVMNFTVDSILIKGTDPVRVLISSSGGEVHLGMTIMHLINDMKRRGIKVIGEVCGESCSIAFFILQCCDERVVSPTSILMIHGIYAEGGGDSRQRESEDKLLSYWRDQLSSILINKSPKKKPKFWKDLMKDVNPLYLTGKEALDLNLVDRIIC